MKSGRKSRLNYDMGSFAHPGKRWANRLNPEAWIWYREVTDMAAARIIDTWWQTETAAVMISPPAGGHPHQAGVRDLPLPRPSPPDVVRTAKAAASRVDEGGIWAGASPAWPGMMRNGYGEIPSASARATGAHQRRPMVGRCILPVTAARRGCRWLLLVMGTASTT